MAQKYNIGDRVVVKFGLTRYHEFGDYHYPPERRYVPGEEFVIEALIRNNEYKVEGSAVILDDRIIDGEATMELWGRMNQYEFNKGDIIVCTYKGKDGTFGGWLEHGEITELGGRYWYENDPDDRKLIDKKHRVACLSENYEVGSAGELSEKEKKNDVEIFRKATPVEIEYYKEVGRGANINTMNKLKIGEYYVVEDPHAGRTDDTFIMIGIAKTEGKIEGNYCRSKATFICPEEKELNTNRDWCYKDNRGRTYRKPTGREMDWLDYCIDNGRFIPYDEFKANKYKEAYSGDNVRMSSSDIQEPLEEKKFPTAGWCTNPSKEVKKYVLQKFNEGKPIEKKANGIAWNGRSAWPIRTSSSYKMYDNEYLESLLPGKKPSSGGTVCVDLETYEAPFMWTAEDNKLPSGTTFIHGRGVGKTHMINSLFPDTDGMVAMHDLEMGNPGDALYIRNPNHDRITAFGDMFSGAMHNRFEPKDEFTQQEAVIMTKKRKKRKLISC